MVPDLPGHGVPPPDDLQLGQKEKTQSVEREHGEGPVESVMPFTEGALARVEHELIPDIIRPDEHERARRIEVDRKIVESLIGDDVPEERFTKLSSRLMGYAWPILLKWMNTGEIFELCKRARKPLRQDAAMVWTDDDRRGMATETVIVAWEYFRATALTKGGWKPGGGASLQTYFVGACILRFADVYGKWRRAHLLDRAMDELPTDEDKVLALSHNRPPDPCQQAVIQDEVRRLIRPMDDQLRQLVGLQAIGYSQREAAEQIGITAKAAERRLARYRNRLDRQAEDES
jgi:DNA-directed RNA polymerase specialized sigma24 family protein